MKFNNNPALPRAHSSLTASLILRLILFRTTALPNFLPAAKPTLVGSTEGFCGSTYSTAALLATDLPFVYTDWKSTLDFKRYLRLI